MNVLCLLLLSASCRAIAVEKNQQGFRNLAGTGDQQKIIERALYQYQTTSAGSILMERLPSERASSSNYYNYPQCGTSGAKKLDNLLTTCGNDNTSSLCCARALTENQMALCKIGDCCLRFLGLKDGNTSGIKLVSTGWTATGISNQKSVTYAKFDDCTGFPTEDSGCDLNCALAIDSTGLKVMDCAISGITVPDEYTPYIPTGRCDAGQVDAKSANKVGAIVGGALGSIIAVFIAAFLAFYCTRKKKEKQSGEDLTKANAEVKDAGINREENLSEHQKQEHGEHMAPECELYQQTSTPMMHAFPAPEQWRAAQADIYTTNIEGVSSDFPEEGSHYFTISSTPNDDTRREFRSENSSSGYNILQFGPGIHIPESHVTRNATEDFSPPTTTGSPTTEGNESAQPFSPNTNAPSVHQSVFRNL